MNIRLYLFFVLVFVCPILCVAQQSVTSATLSGRHRGCAWLISKRRKHSCDASRDESASLNHKRPRWSISIPLPAHRCLRFED